MQSLAVRLANFAGDPFKAAISFQPEYLMDKARQMCKLSDFGGDDFQEPFRLLAHLFGRGADLHFTGRLLAQRGLLRCLANRLRIAEYLRRNPGTEDIPVPAPAVITGLPRSGTTFLQRIMAQDPRTRTLRAWELFDPVPRSRDGASVPDSRRVQAQRAMKLKRNWLYSPHGQDRVKAIHHFEADDPEECHWLLRNSFRNWGFVLWGAGEEYARWFVKQDLTGAYRYYRKQLQILTANGGAGRLLLKYPGHLGSVDELIRVFPNAKILWLHRNPMDSVPSVCSLAMAASSLNTNAADPERIGRMMLERMVWLVRKGMEARRRHPEEQFLDLHYRDLIRDPVQTVLRIYRFLGWRADPDLEDRLRGYVARDRESRSGVRHDYRPEDFGLTRERIGEEFRGYLERFPDAS